MRTASFMLGDDLYRITVDDVNSKALITLNDVWSEEVSWDGSNVSDCSISLFGSEDIAADVLVSLERTLNEC